MNPLLSQQRPITPDRGDEELRVVVVDDHALMRSGVTRALERAPDIRVTGEASDGLGALALLEQDLPDVLLLDFHMPRMDGLSCLERVADQWPGLPVLMLSVEDDPGIATRALAKGAAGYVLKTIHPDDLASMVRTAARGQVLFARPAVSAHAEAVSQPVREGHEEPEQVENARPFADDSPLLAALSEREQEILALVCRGHTNKQIAAELFVTTKTVKFHLTNVFAKLGVSNRTEACVLALSSQSTAGTT